MAYTSTILGKAETKTNATMSFPKELETSFDTVNV